MHIQYGHSEIDKTKIKMTNGSLIKVKSIAEHSATLLTCIKRLLVLKPILVVLRVAVLQNTQVLLHMETSRKIEAAFST